MWEERIILGVIPVGARNQQALRRLKQMNATKNDNK
jgi:hypothetical protein